MHMGEQQRVIQAHWQPKVSEVHILWMSQFLGCDGDSVSATAATLPSIEDVVLGAVPGLPKVHLHNAVLAFEVGDELLKYWHQADEDKLGPFIVVVEGSVPNEKIKQEGYWAALGTDQATGQPIPSTEWLRRLAPKAQAVIACGTCATYGGIHAMSNNPTGCMGVVDFLGKDFRSAAGLPVVNVPGCPIQPDNFMETLLHLLYHLAGLAPMFPLDEQNRPPWLFSEATVHEGCDRGGYYEEGKFADQYGQRECLVKIGCWGPVVDCNVTKRGWMDGIGGCPNVGGVCIACTMPGFPDKFMPFMDEPVGSNLSVTGVYPYGHLIHWLRQFTRRSGNREPKWRHPGEKLTTGYQPTTYGSAGERRPS
jgi:hydrogenase small subunit